MIPEHKIFVLSAQASGSKLLVELLERTPKTRAYIFHGDDVAQHGRIESTMPDATVLVIRSDPFWWRSLMTAMPNASWKCERPRSYALELDVDYDRTLHANAIRILLGYCENREWPMPLIVTYEALCMYPEEVVRTVMEHAGLEYLPVTKDMFYDANEKHLTDEERHDRAQAHERLEREAVPERQQE